MLIPGTRSARALLAAIVAATACASAPQAAVEVVPTPAVTPSDPAFIAKARADSVLRPYTAADIHFMSGMIGHHAQAIVMARWAPTHGASPAVRTLAARIINAQTDEIALMQHWLGDRNQEVPDATPMGMKMEMEGMEHMMLMPGMLNDAQMKELNAARGAEFDRLFLTYMMQHHTGAVTMVHELFATDGAAQDDQVFKFASDVQVDQSTEIARMQRMLAQMTSQKRAP
ncbi:MAG: DUF305 domain-containing protein [Gemmatimonadaceae bacterium]